MLRVPELRPPTGDITQSEFEELLDSLSAGPSLTEEDDAMLGWLMMTVEALDPNGTNTALNSVYACAVLFNGTLDEVEYIIRAVLNHRVT